MIFVGQNGPSSKNHCMKTHMLTVPVFWYSVWVTEQLVFPLHTLAVWWQGWQMQSKTQTPSVSSKQVKTFLLSHHLFGFLSHRGNTQDTVQGSIHIWSNLRKVKWHKHKYTISIFMVSGHMVITCMNIQWQRNVDTKWEKQCLDFFSTFHLTTKWCQYSFVVQCFFLLEQHMVRNYNNSILKLICTFSVFGMCVLCVRCCSHVLHTC